MIFRDPGPGALTASGYNCFCTSGLFPWRKYYGSSWTQIFYHSLTQLLWLFKLSWTCWHLLWRSVPWSLATAIHKNGWQTFRHASLLIHLCFTEKGFLNLEDTGRDFKFLRREILSHSLTGMWFQAWAYTASSLRIHFSFWKDKYLSVHLIYYEQ